MNSEGLVEPDGVGFSAVIPVHNEAKMLRYTLPSIHGLKPKEVIFVLDRCTGSTEKIIRDFWKKRDCGEMKLVLLRVRKKSKWKIHLNFLYDLGIGKAKSEIVLLSQADVLHDYGKIRRNIKDALHGMVSFAVSEHPHIAPWNHFVTKTLQIVGSTFGVKPFSGVVAFSKEYYMTCRLSSNDSFNFDTQLLVSFKNKGHSYVYVLSRNLNLRPWIRSKLWNVGMDRYAAKKPFWNVLLFSLVRFMPEVFAGYLCARLKNKSQFCS